MLPFGNIEFGIIVSFLNRYLHFEYKSNTNDHVVAYNYLPAKPS